MRRRFRFLLLFAIVIFAGRSESLALGANLLYFSDSEAIRRIGLEGGPAQTLIAANAEQIAIDPVGGKMYWGEHGPSYLEGSIVRANLDGTGLEPIVENIGPDGGVTVDTARGVFYWGGATGPQPGQSGIYATSLGGETTEFLFHPLQLDSTLIYLNPSGDRLHMVNTDDAVLFQHTLDGVLSPNTESADTFAFGPGGTTIYWTHGDDLHMSDANGDTATWLATLPAAFIGAIAIEPETSKLFYAAGNSIYRSNLNGTSIETIYQGTSPIQDLVIVDSVLVPEPGNACGFLLSIVLFHAARRRRTAMIALVP